MSTAAVSAVSRKLRRSTNAVSSTRFLASSVDHRRAVDEVCQGGRSTPGVSAARLSTPAIDSACESARRTPRSIAAGVLRGGLRAQGHVELLVVGDGAEAGRVGDVDLAVELRERG